MSYSGKVKKIFEELESGILRQQTEEQIKRVLMATVMILDWSDTNSTAIQKVLNDAMDDPTFSYPVL